MPDGRSQLCHLQAIQMASFVARSGLSLLLLPWGEDEAHRAEEAAAKGMHSDTKKVRDFSSGSHSPAHPASPLSALRPQEESPALQTCRLPV